MVGLKAYAYGRKASIIAERAQPLLSRVRSAATRTLSVFFTYTHPLTHSPTHKDLHTKGLKTDRVSKK